MRDHHTDRLAGTVYVASKFEQWELTRGVQRAMSTRGWRIGFDWTVFAEAELKEHPDYKENAVWDLAGVKTADIAIALLTGDERGTFIEIGYALALGINTLVIDATEDRKSSVFWHHPKVTYLKYEPSLYEPYMRSAVHPVSPPSLTAGELDVDGLMLHVDSFLRARKEHMRRCRLKATGLHFDDEDDEDGEDGEDGENDVWADEL